MGASIWERMGWEGRRIRCSHDLLIGGCRAFGYDFFLLVYFY